MAMNVKPLGDRVGETDKDKISIYARSFRTFRDAEKPH